jgi:glycosyltransferase involved in cell wall biosynthesis
MDKPESPHRPVVLQVLPALQAGGVERGTVEIACAIVEAGGVALVASAGGRLAVAVERAGGRNILLPLATKSPFGIWRNAARLEAVIRAEGVAIVHARSRAPAWSAWLAARRTGARFVTTYHGVYNEDLPLKRRYNAVMAKGEIVIAISHFVAGIVQERHGVDPARIRVIHRGADTALFDPDAVKPDRILKLLRAWRLPDGVPVVMLPGRITRWKGQAVLIEALARMARRDVMAVLVGDAQGRDAYAA